ncbi:cysteine proteinase [Ramaria rubella]|nr:cysteine proteinase [Ramaria rubella]
MHYLLATSQYTPFYVDNPARNECRRRHRRKIELSTRLGVHNLLEPSVPPPALTLDSELQSLTPAQLHELQQNMLDEAAESQHRLLIGPLSSLNALRAEYEGGSMSFVKKIDWLQKEKGFKGIRRTRGDGDCFYRSLAFSYIERIMRAQDVALAVATSISVLQSTLNMLQLAGFDAMVYEDFYEIFVSLIQQVVTPDASDGKTLNTTILLEAFQDPQVSNSIVVFLRLLTSAQIRTDPENYEPFLFHQDTLEPLPVREFCESSVEAVGREADHVQISALSRALRINVKVAYLDGRGNDEKVDFVELQNVEEGYNGMQDVVLLYRPGHYDSLEYREKDD